MARSQSVETANGATKAKGAAKAEGATKAKGATQASSGHLYIHNVYVQSQVRHLKVPWRA